jgi:hypothetical protein
VGTNPAAPDYIGKHPGNAYMELQFYGPGYVPQFEGFGCTAHQYCAAMTIDSLSLNQNTGVANTSACNNFILGGEEPINWAYITRNGVSQAPANPLFTGTFTNPNFSAVNPDVNKDLLMNPGDRIRFHMHDTPAGFRVDMTDLSTGKRGSMTASTANGFGHILYTPGNSNPCQVAPYAFHPEYSTGNPRGNTWSAHTYNVAMSDEIGHFENCLAIDLVVAWRVMRLTMLGRATPDVACTVFFEEHEWKALYAFVGKGLHAIPPHTPSLRDAQRTVARLGGFLGRKGDADPGVKSIWIGLQRLDDISGAWLMFGPGSPLQPDHPLAALATSDPGLASR